MSEINNYVNNRMHDPEFARAWQETECAYQVARQIIRLRLENKMTQEEVAKKMGTTQSVIARIEQGGQNISLRTLQKLALALDADIKIEMVHRS